MFTGLGGVNPYLVVGSLLAAILAFGAGYYKGNESGQAEVKRKWDEEKVEMLARHADAVEKARKREQNLQQSADSLRKEKDAEIRNINARATALANSLRDRQSRPNSSALPSTASIGQSACTGAQLYREDGELLVGLAREADELVAALKQCYAQYDAARQPVK